MTHTGPGLMDGVSPVGALSRIGPEQILSTMTMVETGEVHDLGLELNESVPQGPPGAFAPYSLTWRVTPEGSNRGHHYRYAAESISGPLHVGTHLDGLAHVVTGGRIYGGHVAAEVRDDTGFRVHGMETVPPIVTRGIVIDVAALHDVAALPDGYDVSVADVSAALSRAGRQVRRGDAVLVRTGKVREYGTNNRRYQAAQPGVGPAAAIWLYERGMALLGTDTTGTEPLPFPDETRTTHQAMLVERGVHLLENVTLEQTVAAGVTAGLFICLPLRLTGATGSWVRPILIT